MPQSRTEASLRARRAALIRASKYDGREVTQAAREAFLRRFELEVDPDEKLPEPERRRRAMALRRAWMLDLAIKSARTRRGDI